MEKENKEQSFIIAKIQEVDAQAAIWFEEHGFSDQMFQHLVWDCMSDVIPGTGDGMAYVRKSKVWKIIKDWRDQFADTPPIKRKKQKITFKDEITEKSERGITVENEALQNSTKSNLFPQSDLEKDVETQSPHNETESNSPPQGTPENKAKFQPLQDLTESSCNRSDEILPNPTMSDATSSSSSDCIDTGTIPKLSPPYLIYYDKILAPYTDPNLDMPETIQKHLIHSTMTNMTSKAFSFAQRIPTWNEITQMGKSLFIKYPSLGKTDADKKDFLKRLHRKKYNNSQKFKLTSQSPKSTLFSPKTTTKTKSKPSQKQNNVKEQPSNITNLPTSQHIESAAEDSDATVDYSNEYPSGFSYNRSDCSEPTKTIDARIAERYFAFLDKEQKKKKPNLETIEYYLKLDFPSRRKFVKALDQEKRVIKFFDKYPIFRSHVQIVQEAKRIIGTEEPDFLQKCFERLKLEAQNILFYSIDQKSMTAKVVMSYDNNMCCILENFQAIFQKSKKKASKSTLYLEIEGHDDLKKKIKSNQLVILNDVQSKEYIIYQDSSIICRVTTSIEEAFITLLCLFYVLDLDYPKSQEHGFCFMQNLILKDTSCPAELITSLQESLKNYEEYKKL